MSLSPYHLTQTVALHPGLHSSSLSTLIASAPVTNQWRYKSPGLSPCKSRSIVVVIIILSRLAFSSRLSRRLPIGLSLARYKDYSLVSSLYGLRTLLLNVSKTKELIVDFSTKQERNYQTPIINESPVERVNSFKYLGVHITQDLSWSWHINTVVKKARQRLYHLRRLRDFRLPSKVLRNFYSCTIESILTGNILTWFGNSTMQDRRALQRVVRSAERTIHTELPDLHSIYSRRCWTKARKIVKDLSHPNNGLFSLMRSGKRFRSLKANTERLRRSFFPQAIRSLNQYITQY
ncbi:hypothetical protein M9458_020973 [Cirrhinus mrigala]|uniref:Alkylated DNA repair protein AlkB homologue 8 N-terminal domain-containing protein n=1 Tax=Cirrhinus mrigala TaxID=683832 RepID=A0ABD0QGF9_CIRMR